MKSCTFFLLFLLYAVSSYTQFRRLLPDSSTGLQLLEREKQSYERIQQGNSRENTVASDNFDIYYYRCEWTIDPALRFISGKITSCFLVTQAGNTLTYDLSDTLNIDSIVYHGAPIAWQKTANDGLLLQLPVNLVPGQKDSVTIIYNGVPKNRKNFQAFTKFVHSGVPGISTLSEPYGAKDWWPCKNGLTDKADSIDIFITTPPVYKGISNGLLVSDETAGSNRTLHYRHRYAIASYLVALAVTNYETNIDSIQLGSRTMPVIRHYYPESIYNMQTASSTAKGCLEKFSGLFGDYPFINEQYAQTQWSTGGGMEHQTNSFISGAGPQLVAHELGHQWFGDMVTAASWQHIWLHEGFADYLQYVYVEYFESNIKLIHLNAHMNLALSDSSGSVFVTDTSNPSRIFDIHSYYKGGYVLHMLRGILGDSLFFKGVRNYLNDPLVKYKFASTEDLQRNLEQVSGKNLQSFFSKWIYGEGYPNYSSSWYQNNNNWAHVQLNQTTTHPSVSFYEMPVQLRFKNSTRDTVLTVAHTFSGQVVWVNPGFKADSMFIDPYLWILARQRTVKKDPAPVTLPDDIQIYPNPAPLSLNISLRNPVAEKIIICLFNAAGQLVYQSEQVLQGRDELIPVSTAALAHGVYIVTVTGNKKTLATKKIIR